MILPKLKMDWHNSVSVIKSVLRIIAGFVLVLNNVPAAGIIFIIAEVAGIIEEF